MSDNEVIFLTGFPGFIAKRLVWQLAAKRESKFLLLVQPAFAAQAQAEIKQISEATNRDDDAGDFRILEGDITQPECGLSKPDAELARREATAVFHLAALYDLAVARDIAMRVNVEGTQNVNRLAATFPRLRRYNYVSTCYVAGRRAGVIRETELRHEAGFRNYYEETKYLAELEVEALKGKLPVTIYRPAVVCGDSQTGETAKYDGIYYLINYLRLQPNLLSLFNIGNRTVRLNIVPIDFVVNSIAALSTDEHAVSRTLHLADPAPLTTEELFNTIARHLVGRAARLRLPPALVHTTLRLPMSPLLTGLPSSGVPYFFLDQTYDTLQAQTLLEPYAIHCPPFDSYITNLIDFVERTKVGSRKAEGESVDKAKRL